MFVYQNANRDICVTFTGNKPVETPEYVISIDHAAGTISVNGELMQAVSEETEDATETVTETTKETKGTSTKGTTQPVVEEETDSEEE